MFSPASLYNTSFGESTSVFVCKLLTTIFNCKMRDDPEFNIKYIALIEKHPCLYDYMSSDYSRRNIQDKAWETIAKELRESVQDCKERWRNLKAPIGRSGSGTRVKKPYYLAEYLTFLLPFTKSRKSQGNISTSVSTIASPEQTLEDEDDDEDTNNEIDLEDTKIANKSGDSQRATEPQVSQTIEESFANSESDDFVIPAAKKMKQTSKIHSHTSIAEVNKTALEYFKSKKASAEKKSADDPDLGFLISVLPDMKEMDNSQKRQFKMGILNLANQILGDKPPPSPASSTSSSSSAVIQTYNYQQPAQSFDYPRGSEYCSNDSSSTTTAFSTDSINLREYLEFNHDK